MLQSVIVIQLYKCLIFNSQDYSKTVLALNFEQPLMFSLIFRKNCFELQSKLGQ